MRPTVHLEKLLPDKYGFSGRSSLSNRHVGGFFLLYNSCITALREVRRANNQPIFHAC